LRIAQEQDETPLATPVVDGDSACALRMKRRSAAGGEPTAATRVVAGLSVATAVVGVVLWVPFTGPAGASLVAVVLVTALCGSSMQCLIPGDPDWRQFGLIMAISVAWTVLMFADRRFLLPVQLFLRMAAIAILLRAGWGFWKARPDGPAMLGSAAGCLLGSGLISLVSSLVPSGLGEYLMVRGGEWSDVIVAVPLVAGWSSRTLRERTGYDRLRDFRRLRTATLFGRRDRLADLLNRGTEVTFPGWAPALFLAIGMDYPNAARELLAAGADPESLHKYRGRTISAITYAKEKGSPDIVSLFAEAGYLP